MTERMLMAAVLTARRMTGDPEAESIAGEAAMEAERTYDPAKGATPEQWASYVTRTRVWTYWRSQRSRRTEYSPDLDPACEDDAPSDPPVSAEDWLILVERYVNGVAEWSLARRFGVTVYAMRRRLHAAKARFLTEVGA